MSGPDGGDNNPEVRAETRRDAAQDKTSRNERPELERTKPAADDGFNAMMRKLLGPALDTDEQRPALDTDQQRPALDTDEQRPALDDAQRSRSAADGAEAGGPGAGAAERRSEGAPFNDSGRALLAHLGVKPEQLPEASQKRLADGLQQAEQAIRANAQLIEKDGSGTSEVNVAGEGYTLRIERQTDPRTGEVRTALAFKDSDAVEVAAQQTDSPVRPSTAGDRLTPTEARARLDRYIAGLTERLATAKDRSGEPLRITDLHAKRSNTNPDMYEIYGKVRYWEVVPTGINPISPPGEVERTALVRLGGFVPGTGETLTSQQIDSRAGLAVAEKGPLEYAMDAVALAGIVRSVGKAIVARVAARAEGAAAAELAPSLGARPAAAAGGEGRLASELPTPTVGPAPVRPPGAVAGAETRALSQQEYNAALSRAYPEQHFNDVARVVDDIGQRTAQRAVNDQTFRNAVANQNWTSAGNRFHNIAAEEAKALPAGTLPKGWHLEAEYTIRAGKGGSRADILAQGPQGQLLEFDWKTTGASALKSQGQMAKHADHIARDITPLRGGTLAGQESRSWVDYVRPLLPNAKWR